MDRAPPSLDIGADPIERPRVVARDGTAISVTYRNRWNVHDLVALHDVPPLLRAAFVHAEDHRFHRHHGVDWVARAHALWQNLLRLRVVRGASTISEQVVRIVRPRPRNVWSRWVEGFEAMRLERHHGKDAILEFYLNQVPYAGERRGVVQAARHYFARSPDTLSLAESLALAVMVRAPSRLDLRKHPLRVVARVRTLANRLRADGVITQADRRRAHASPLATTMPGLPLEAPHFVRHVLGRRGKKPVRARVLRTTLDPELQRVAHSMLEQRLQSLGPRGVGDGAVLVADHHTREILAWAVGGSGGYVDPVTTARQPGSTLKPFLYALALESGWTAATLIDDVALHASVGSGMHTYRNYSGTHHGKVTLRTALASSLNIPAVRTLRFVGRARFVERLRDLGFDHLTEHPDIYGDGIALGNSGVTLYELVRAYASLADRGWLRPLEVGSGRWSATARTRVFSAEISSLIADMLSDARARALEFGRGGVLHMPVQTAIKTGTSSDYRDAWAVAFNHRYVVGAWMGNLNAQPMAEISGARGPALVVRSLLAHLNRRTVPRRLYLSPQLESREVCAALANATCVGQTEWFIPGTAVPTEVPGDPARTLHIREPTDGLHLALDPRIPDVRERFRFRVSSRHRDEQVHWFLNGAHVATTDDSSWLWSASRGRHRLRAALVQAGEVLLTSAPVHFEVR